MKNLSGLTLLPCLLGAAALTPSASLAQNPPPPDHPKITVQGQSLLRASEQERRRPDLLAPSRGAGANIPTSASKCARPAVNVRPTRSPRLKKSGPTPALRAMKAPSTIGRPAVPCSVVTPEVMLNVRALPLPPEPTAGPISPYYRGKRRRFRRLRQRR